MNQLGMNNQNRPTQHAAAPLRQLAADAVLWLIFVLLLTGFRGLMIWAFRAELSPQTGAAAGLRCFTTGLRYDVSVVTLLLIPSVLLTLVTLLRPLGDWPNRIRRLTTMIGMTACTIAFITDFGFYGEYHDQFNHWIFGLLYDDRQAIFQTIWKSYPVVMIFCGAVVANCLTCWWAGKLWRSASTLSQIPSRTPAAFFKIGIWILVVGLVVVGARGSAGRRPVQLKDAATTGDPFLNKLVLNPFAALRYTFLQRHLLQSAAGLRNFLPDGDVVAAARNIFPQTTDPTRLDVCLERLARGGPGPKPNHIFIVVMESYDAWPMEPRFAALGLTDRLSALAQTGIASRAFVSGGDGTMKSLAVMITGLPEVGVYPNFQPALRQPVPTSAAAIFQRLGYRPRFFYGGYLSWQRLGDFSRDQGFSEVYGGDQMSGKLTGNEWGVDDEVLFRFVLEHTGSEPTFNIIMSTSYHPPYSVDLRAKGFPEEKLINSASGKALDPDQVRLYGHLWYADHCLGEFVANAEQQLTRPLFAITGDHWSRRCLDPRPTLYERHAVPLVLAGREVLEQQAHRPALAGSHIDIVPTLVNLAAPRGFVYHAFGRDLLDATQSQFGAGVGVVVGPDFILAVGNHSLPEDFQGHPLTADQRPSEPLDLYYRQVHALGWWRIMKGSALLNPPRPR